ncbi:MAG TPA: hypothetical protein VKT49_10570 [Bryobacteraceae bacterium]|nr:hypothetical protein [Bryobacteraceae bacterium]
MLILSGCLMVLAVAACLRIGAKEPPLDRDVVRRIRRFAERMRREELLPYE